MRPPLNQGGAGGKSGQRRAATRRWGSSPPLGDVYGITIGVIGTATRALYHAREVDFEVDLTDRQVPVKHETCQLVK